MKIIVSIWFSLMVKTILYGQINSNYLDKVLSDIEKVKSASYFRYLSVTEPYDTIPSSTSNVYIKEYINPADTFVGACIAEFLSEDTLKMLYFYNGNVRSSLDWNNKTIRVDSFENNPYPFRTIYPPFFTQIKSIIKYSLRTDDVSFDIRNYRDSMLIRIIFNNKYIEVVGNHVIDENPPDLIGDKRSEYDIWINNSTGLPYKLKKILPKTTWWETCQIVGINKLIHENFVETKYLPSDFKIISRMDRKSDESTLLGKIAPDWKLKDNDNNEFSLSSLKSKILLIEFTGMGCGPCQLSIPFLKEVVTCYENKDFELISIETMCKEILRLKKHMNINDISYKYFISSENLKFKYNVVAVPTYFILDEKRIIRKIVTGYSKGITENEIYNTINQLIAR